MIACSRGYPSCRSRPRPGPISSPVTPFAHLSWRMREMVGVTDRQSDFEHLQFERHSDHIVEVILHRPPVNAVDESFIGELGAAAEVIECDRSIRVAIVSSAASAFMV